MAQIQASNPSPSGQVLDSLQPLNRSGLNFNSFALGRPFCGAMRSARLEWESRTTGVSGAALKNGRGCMASWNRRRGVLFRVTSGGAALARVARSKGAAAVNAVARGAIALLTPYPLPQAGKDLRAWQPPGWHPFSICNFATLPQLIARDGVSGPISSGLRLFFAGMLASNASANVREVAAGGCRFRTILRAITAGWGGGGWLAWQTGLTRDGG